MVKQVQITKVGGPDVLKVIQTTPKELADKQVRIATKFCGINFADLLARKGLYPDAPPLPTVVGYEASGIVTETRSSAFNLGDEVIVLSRFGGYSSELVVHEKQVFKKPASLSMEQAAAIPVNYLTAWQLIVVMGGLKKGETILIHNAGGGVGLAALEIAKNIGAISIGTASASKHDRLIARGLTHAVDYRKGDWAEQVRKLTGGKGVDLILDPVGGPYWSLNYKLLRAGGRLGFFGVSYASVEGSRSGFGLLKLLPHFRMWNPAQLMNGNKAVFGVNLGHMWHEADRIATWAEALLKGCDTGWINPVVDSVFSFEQAGEAHQQLETRKNFGKVLLTP
jgi:NADPH:quinone reductase-like Zn-dependent oxidoreductase